MIFVLSLWCDKTELQNQDSVVYYIKPSLLSKEQNKLKWEHNIELFSEKQTLDICEKSATSNNDNSLKTHTLLDKWIHVMLIHIGFTWKLGK